MQVYTVSHNQRAARYAEQISTGESGGALISDNLRKYYRNAIRLSSRNSLHRRNTQPPKSSTQKAHMHGRSQDFLKEGVATDVESWKAGGRKGSLL